MKQAFAGAQSSTSPQFLSGPNGSNPTGRAGVSGGLEPVPCDISGICVRCPRLKAAPISGPVRCGFNADSGCCHAAILLPHPPASFASSGVRPPASVMRVSANAAPVSRRSVDRSFAMRPYSAAFEPSKEDLSAELRQGRSDQDSSPCPTLPQSHAQTPAASLHMRRLPRRPGAGSSNRR